MLRCTHDVSPIGTGACSSTYWSCIWLQCSLGLACWVACPWQHRDQAFKRARHVTQYLGPWPGHHVNQLACKSPPRLEVHLLVATRKFRSWCPKGFKFAEHHLNWLYRQGHMPTICTCLTMHQFILHATNSGDTCMKHKQVHCGANKRPQQGLPLWLHLYGGSLVAAMLCYLGASAQ